MRFFIAYLIIKSFQWKRKEKIEIHDWKYLIIMALGGITLFYYFESEGLRFTTVTNTSLITATIPLFTLLAAAIFFKKKLLWQNAIGIPLGILGTVFLFYKDILHSSLHLKGDLLVFGSVIMWLFYSFSYRKVMDKYSSKTITEIIFMIGVISIIPILFFERKVFFEANWNLQVFFSLVFLAVVCSYLAYYFWNIAIRNIGIKITSNLILFIPIVSISAGIIVFSEPFSIHLVWSTMFIIVGAYLSSISAPEHHF